MPVMKTFIESHEVDTNSRAIKRNFFFEYASPIRLSQRASVPSFMFVEITSPGTWPRRFDLRQLRRPLRDPRRRPGHARDRSQLLSHGS
jgi:hypothetical protein